MKELQYDREKFKQLTVNYYVFHVLCAVTRSFIRYSYLSHEHTWITIHVNIFLRVSNYLSQNFPDLNGYLKLTENKEIFLGVKFRIYFKTGIYNLSSPTPIKIIIVYYEIGFLFIHNICLSCLLYILTHNQILNNTWVSASLNNTREQYSSK